MKFRRNERVFLYYVYAYVSLKVSPLSACVRDMLSVIFFLNFFFILYITGDEYGRVYV
jgi:hypothetical protein